jgi:hypothetical protein
MDQSEILQERLSATFPLHVCEAAAAPHDCLECSEIRLTLDGATWVEVPSTFIQEHDDILPLLSDEARHAFLPAWLREAVLRPDSLAAHMLMTHLELQSPSELFTVRQARLILDIAEWLAIHNGFGPADPVALDSLERVRRTWRSAAA